jgi:cell wall-associated NlpC family hydrolase
MVDSSAADAQWSDAEERRAQTLRTVAQQWRGTPHVWGGTSREGIDCSGLVQVVYQEALGHDLPRTTRAQSRAGTSVSSALQPGDLVFFRVDTRKGRHVGMYLSDGEFLHASASDGVRISSLDTAYWQERWWQARRVLTAPDSSHQSAAPSSSRRGGW